MTSMPWLVGTMSRLVEGHSDRSKTKLPVGAQVEVLQLLALPQWSGSSENCYDHCKHEAAPMNNPHCRAAIDM
jgi:hypothetical protein